MKTSTLAKSIVGLSVLFSISTVNAAVSMTTPMSSSGFQFASSGLSGNSFTDYLSFTTLDADRINATASGSGDPAFSFTTFDLLAADKTTVLAVGSIANLSASLSFAGFNSTQAGGTYWLEIAGTYSGASAGYNGTVTLTPVPEPESTALMMAGLGLIGLIARRKFV